MAWAETKLTAEQIAIVEEATGRGGGLQIDNSELKNANWGLLQGAFGMIEGRRRPFPPEAVFGPAFAPAGGVGSTEYAVIVRDGGRGRLNAEC